MDKEFCEFYRDRHAFKDERSMFCECGEVKRMPCTCTDCGLYHRKQVPATSEEKLKHYLRRLEERISALEISPSESRISITTTPADKFIA